MWARKRNMSDQRLRARSRSRSERRRCGQAVAANPSEWLVCRHMSLSQGCPYLIALAIRRVPSDPANSPFSDWHAQSEHSTQGSGDVVLLLPVAAFIRPRISAPEPICLFYLLEARVSKQTFARPHRLLPFESHRSEVNAPALSLRRNSELFFQSVRP